MKPLETEGVRGRIHSYESCGMVDGPGLRFIVFFQGCPLRCLYCHNPDSWAMKAGTETSSAQVVWEARKYKTWFQSSGGGITLSGGEPLAQPEFATDILLRAKDWGLHTALDTSGVGNWERIRPVLDAADLVLLDLKSADNTLHKRLTGLDRSKTLRSLDYLKAQDKPMWIRHVLVPGLTDSEEHLDALAQELSAIPSLERFDLLPFHKMGESKWEIEGIPYQLGHTPSPTTEAWEAAAEIFRARGISVKRS